MQVIDQELQKKQVADFQVGDTLKVHLKVKEGDKTRVQVFEGVCLRKRGEGAGKTFSVIKETHGDMVEKIFPLYSPTIEKIQIVRKGKVRRARLYYLRKKKVIL
ncbi:MAG: 50S ribosomal protein L19 [Candidatus Omnitrophica bacterium]|nr:50S ribosomal protein L19 [Candidatus Omnitrophota bacterium]